MVNLKEISLADIAPDSITKSKKVQAAITAIDPELRLVAAATREAQILARLDELPEGVIDSLAWQYHVDFYDTALSIEQKRNLVRDSILWHKKKGTPWAVRRVLENLGLKCNIKEWFNTGALPHTFSVEIVYPPDPSKTFTFMGENTEELIRAAINDAKPVRADLSNLVATTLDQIEQDGYIPEVHVCIWDDKCLWDHAYIESIGKPEVLRTGISARKVAAALNYLHSTSAITQSYLIWNVSTWNDWPYVVQPKPAMTFVLSATVKTENQRVKYTDLTNFAETENVWDFGEWDGNTINEPYIKVLEDVGTWDGSAVWNTLATVPDDGSQYHTLDTWQDRASWKTGTWASLEAVDKKENPNKRNLYEPHWDRIDHFGQGVGTVIDISDLTLSQLECKQQFFSYFSLRSKIVNDKGGVKIAWHERAGFTWKTTPNWGKMTWKDEAYFALTETVNAATLLDSLPEPQVDIYFVIRDFIRYIVGPTWDVTKWDNGVFMKPNVVELEEHVSRVDRLDTSSIRVTEGVFESFPESEAVWNATEADGLAVSEPQYRVIASVGEWDSDANFDEVLPEPKIIKVEKFSTGISSVIDISGIVDSARTGNCIWTQEA